MPRAVPVVYVKYLPRPIELHKIIIIILLLQELELD